MSDATISLGSANLAMYDRATESLWNQLEGRAVVRVLADLFGGHAAVIFLCTARRSFLTPQFTPAHTPAIG